VEGERDRKGQLGSRSTEKISLRREIPAYSAGAEGGDGPKKELKLARDKNEIYLIFGTRARINEIR